MLQTIKKRFFPCEKMAKRTSAVEAVPLRELAVLVLLLAGGARGAAAQESSSAGGKPVVAAPGTAPLSAEAKAALAAPYTGPSYKNRWEMYGGLSFMNGQAGQNLPKRYNMGGAEVMGTYWLGPNLLGGHVSKLGVIGDYRFEAGTTPVVSPYYNRILIMQSITSGGLEYRGPKNRYVAIDFHALAGGAYGHFDYAVNHYPGGSPVSSCPTNGHPPQTTTLGLYCDHTAPWGAAGGSIDFNESQKLAIRLSPDMIFEHFGTETREFFSISMGALYRFGKK
jgi:hypothetical protein